MLCSSDPLRRSGVNAVWHMPHSGGALTPWHMPHSGETAPPGNLPGNLPGGREILPGGICHTGGMSTSHCTPSAKPCGICHTRLVWHMPPQVAPSRGTPHGSARVAYATPGAAHPPQGALCGICHPQGPCPLKGPCVAYATHRVCSLLLRSCAFGGVV